MSRVFFAAVCGLLSISFMAQASQQSLVIYGEDDRKDIFEVTESRWREVADSTVAQIPSTRIRSSGNGTFNIESTTFGRDYALCSDERFFNQPNPAVCSGFLVGEDLVATAGHCISESNCADYSYAFGFRMTSPTVPPTNMPESDLYKCKQIIKREQTGNQDYALVRLDRPVRGHRILKMATGGVNVGQEITVIGHPSGIPTKVSGGAKVRELRTGFFMANLDTYGGNSGSAVFDNNTLDVVGILVRGETDFTYDRAAGCTRSNVCTNEGCRGEDVTNISFIRNVMPR